MRLFVSEGRPSELAILAANHTTTNKLDLRDPYLEADCFSAPCWGKYKQSVY